MSSYTLSKDLYHYVVAFYRNMFRHSGPHQFTSLQANEEQSVETCFYKRPLNNDISVFKVNVEFTIYTVFVNTFDCAQLPMLEKRTENWFVFTWLLKGTC